ncbi:MAG: hypothetical protein IT302_02065 [Dehalococcoidia bacterium]|nr:hypothetical protein [Dehalococcoidia bacterium]
MPEEQDRESLLGRLHEATSAEAALRQLRRRYEQLQLEYDSLASRLSGLESAAGVSALGTGSSLAEALREPLRRMLDEYTIARAQADAIIEGLRGLALVESETSAAPEPAAQPVASSGTSRVSVRVGGNDLGALLDFQERLSDLPGVARVSIETAGSGASSLMVELS